MRIVRRSARDLLRRRGDILPGAARRAAGRAALWLALAAAAPAVAADFNFEVLRALIAERHVDSVESLLGALPEDLRANYALVFSSRSLQEASFESPRVILFDRSAEFIVTFNGDPAQRGFESVETMEFDATANRFTFRELAFAPGRAPTVSVSEANPARCTVCHDTPARPIWDAAPLWPGVYGERYGSGLSSVESRGMRQFLAQQSAHGRYRYLLHASTLADRDTYVSSKRAAYNGAAPEPPNARLSALLASLNVRFILSQLAVRPGFVAHLPALLAAAGSSCGPVAGFYPADRAGAIEADRRQFAAQATAAARRQSLAKGLRSAGHSAYSAASVDFTDLRYLAERGLGMSTQHWTLALERGSYDLSAPGDALTFEQAFFAWLVRVDPNLRTAAAYRTFNPQDAYCQHLRLVSRASLGDWYAGQSGAEVSPPLVAAALSGGVARLSPCIGCHSSGIAPPLPFADLRALSARLSEQGYAHGRLLDEILFRLTPEAGAARMPRGINLDAASQHELEDLFIALSRSP